MAQVPAINVEVEKVENGVTTCAVAVIVGDNEFDFTVIVESAYLQKIAKDETVISLVKKSFEFLLDREPPENILKTFNISQIVTYFPEYPKEVGNY